MPRYALAVAVVVLVAGCSAPGGASAPSIEAPTVTAAPGDSGTMTVDARHVQSLGADPVQSDHVELDWTNASVTPDASAVFTSLPPAWVWETPTTVTLTIPYSVVEDASEGTHEFELYATNDDGEDRIRKTATGTIVVEP